MAKNSTFVDFSQGVSTIDPAVQALIHGGQRRQAERSLNPEQRSKRAKARKKMAARHRVTYDLPPALSEEIETWAEHLGCPASQVVKALLAYGIEHVDIAALREIREPSNSPRYDWVLDVEKLKVDD